MDERIKAIISASAIIIVNAVSFWGISLDLGVLTNALFAIAMLVSTIYGIWKNHNFTFAAAQGQLVVDHIKTEQKATKLGDGDA